MPEAPQRVVIVGGGVGGVSCAAALRSGGYTGDLTLVDRADFPYDRPPLSKDYLAGTRDLTQIALQPPEWYADQRVELVTQTNVAALKCADDDTRVVLDDGRELVADRIVLATGGRAALPPIPGANSSGERVYVLREADDADRLRSALVPGARLLVVGGGLIGAETASTARDLGCEVVLVDPLDPPIAAAVGQQVACWLHAQHAAHGIETVTTTVKSLQTTRNGVAAQLLGESDARTFDAVLIGVGMVPETALAEAAGLQVDRGVLVDAGQTTSHPRVLAIGDTARLRGHHRTEHWEAAQHDGQRAAATLLGTDQPARTASWFWSDRHHRHIEGVGTMREPDSEHIVVLRGEPGDRPFSAFTLHTGKVVGAVAVDDSQAARAARRLIDRGIAVDADSLTNPATDLRRLLRG